MNRINSCLVHVKVEGYVMSLQITDSTDLIGLLLMS